MGLNKLLRRIDEYRITGAQPIMEEIDMMFGRTVRDAEYREYLSSSLGKGLIDALSAVAASVIIVLGVPQFPGAVSRTLRLPHLL